MSCLDNIVTLGLCADEPVSSSGFTLLNAAGINLKNLALITDSGASGVDMALEVKQRSIIQVRNDFISALQLNQIVPAVSKPAYETGMFITANSVGTFDGYRGVNVYKNNAYKGNLRKTILESIQVYPLASGDSTIKVFDGFNTYTYAVTLVANQINVFDQTQLAGFPFELPAQSGAVRVTIDQSTIPFLSTKITCMKGCGGGMPNPCGWADGWDGTAATKNEGYGMVLTFKCECDYDKVLCDLSKSFMGELIWLKWQYNIFDEQYKSNRFENLVIYDREDLLENIMPDIENRYNEKWNALMKGLLDVLRTYRDDCLDCRRTRFFANV